MRIAKYFKQKCRVGLSGSESIAPTWTSTNFHITNLGVDHVDIFDTSVDHAVFEHEVEVAADRFGIEIHAYCWMSNHFHLIVNCPNGQLSRFMQRFEQQYVLKHNRAIGRRGPLFISRFSSFPIGITDHDPEDGALVVSRYVHRNPLDIVPVAKLAAYPYSSYGVYLGLRRPPPWLRTDVLGDLFDTCTFGLHTFTERNHPGDRTPAAGRRHRPFGLDQVLSAAASVAGVTVNALIKPSGGASRRDRALAAALVVPARALEQRARNAGRSRVNLEMWTHRDQVGAFHSEPDALGQAERRPARACWRLPSRKSTST